MAASSDHPTEQSPLLGNETNEVDETQPSQEDQDDEILVEEPSTAKLALILGSIWIGVFFAALDSTIIATLATPISDSFNSFTLLAWLATGYLIANAAVQPLSGKLTDIYGRRAGLLFANVFFCAGTLMCGLAQNSGTVIAGRVIAGTGGGCLNAISTYVASDLVPLRRRGIYQGLGNIVWGVGSGLGGVFGGWIADNKGWRWAFLIQIPFIIVSAIIVFFMVNIPVKETDKSKIKRVDFAGAFTLCLTLVLLLLGLNSGGNIVPWNHPLVYVSLVLSFFSLLAFIYVEQKLAAEPIIPLYLLLDRTVASVCATLWFSSMGMFGFLYYGPIYFQVLGASATQAGIKIIPAPVGTAVGSLLVGYLMRLTGRYWYLNILMETSPIIGGILMVIFLDQHTPEWIPYIIFFLGGFGYGGLLTITLLAMISAVAHKFQAVVTAASYAARSTGSSIGITVASMIFQNLLKRNLYDRLGDWDGADDIIPRLRNSVEEIKNLPPGWKGPVLGAYMDALQGVWATLLGLFALAGFLSLFMRENTLHTSLSRK